MNTAVRAKVLNKKITGLELFTIDHAENVDDVRHTFDKVKMDFHDGEVTQTRIWECP